MACVKALCLLILREVNYTYYAKPLTSYGKYEMQLLFKARKIISAHIIENLSRIL